MGGAGGERLRVLLVDGERGLGDAVAVALARLGSEVLWLGMAPPPDGVQGLRALSDTRRSIDPAALGRGAFDAAVDFGARGGDDPVALARLLRGRVGLVLQLGSWSVYAGAEEAPARGAQVRGVGSQAWGCPPLPARESAPKQDGPDLAAEDALWQERARGDYPAAVLRLAALYGPGVGLAREWFVVARLRAGRARLALGDGGHHLLHRVYVDNAVHAVVRALDHPRETDGRAFNVGDSHVPSAAALASEIARAAGRPLDVVPVPSALRPPAHPWAVPNPVVLDLCHLRTRLGFNEPVPPDEGLARTVRWLWDLPEADASTALRAYFRRWREAHDQADEDAALARWHAVGT